MENIDMSIRKRIQTARENSGLTQNQLGEKIHITGQQVQKYEKDKAIPKVSTLISIANILGISLDYLINENAENNEIKNITAAIESLDKENKETVKKVIKGLKVVQETEKMKNLS